MDQNPWRIPTGVFLRHSPNDPPPHAFPAQHEDHVHRRPGKEFVDDIADRGLKQQPLPEGKKTLIEALRQTLELEVVKLTIRFFTRLRKTSDRALWRSRPHPVGRRDYRQLKCRRCRSTGHLRKFCPNGKTPVGYSKRETLRREKCDMTT
jgi:hypothetical protein